MFRTRSPTRSSSKASLPIFPGFTPVKVRRLCPDQSKQVLNDNNSQFIVSPRSNLVSSFCDVVAQTLQLPYSTIDQLPKIFDDIKAEIQKSCPTIITDGSHPFQCYWVNFGKDHVEVRVNVHFRISPVGDRYYENRQECLMAIDRAIRNNEIEKYSGSK